MGNRRTDEHTGDLRGLIRTDERLYIFIDALADLILKLVGIRVVIVAGRDEMLSLLLVHLLNCNFLLYELSLLLLLLIWLINR